MDSCTVSPNYNRADILCVCMMLSLMHVDTISKIQYMQYIFVMGTTTLSPIKDLKKAKVRLCEA